MTTSIRSKPIEKANQGKLTPEVTKSSPGVVKATSLKIFPKKLFK